jgi:hypothetical protein
MAKQHTNNVIENLMDIPLSPNGRVRQGSPSTDPTIEEMQAQFEALGRKIAQKQEAQKAPYANISTNSAGRLKSLFWVFGLAMAAGFLYNYIVINDLSMRPIDVAGVQKVLISIIVFLLALLMVERSLKYFVPYLHHYFLNDRDSEQDFSTHLQQLKPYQLVCVTCFFIGLFFWGFITVLGVKW